MKLIQIVYLTILADLAIPSAMFTPVALAAIPNVFCDPPYVHFKDSLVGCSQGKTPMQVYKPNGRFGACCVQATAANSLAEQI
ncbi:uncharacterized protein EDB93DRAFT_1184578 [Suillus bovinus]|uniref:uncharacterized protein n=1 Tax=Suillus bovinus TaxID=48563 RepID=UPI001B864861|nr:uncharacterized protein EDB93DRAFT_1184578 [Suillus bovinus]KAG2128362.1 hypothetical protein EDB93DRAFT_1184578 [Suillus bovinus]